MTKADAVKALLRRFEIGAKLLPVQDDEDEWTCIPDPQDLKVVEAILGRTVTEDDLWFNVGAGSRRSWYALHPNVISRLDI